MVLLKRIPFLILVFLVVFAVFLLIYSKYMFKTDLEVVILNQTSECYSEQTMFSEARWSGRDIIMETAFETPDPCYRIHSIQAFQQGDRIEVRIKTMPGGVCVQCFGYKILKYEISSPEERDFHIHINVEDTAKHELFLLRD